ncbi:MAG TPA: CNNM domain-containing protein [Patescibacteria group bacterium]|nr:CNNM domain-containing protein [Patescibacteria group bacterium]
MEIALIAIGGIISGLCALFSAVLTSLAPASYAILEHGENKATEGLEDVKQNMNYALMALLVLDTLAHTMAAVVAGAAVFDWYGHWSAVLYATLVAFFSIGFLKVFFKGIGVRYAERLAVSTGAIMRVLVTLLKPIVVMFEAFSRLVGGVRSDEAAREELNALVENAHEEGTLEAGEYRILKNIMRLSTVHVADVMTPRTVLFSCNADMTVEEAISLPELQMYSRFPIWEGESLDGVIGYVITKHVFQAALAGKRNQTLRELVREVYFIPENVQLDKALELFLEKRLLMFVVVDEYGGVEGLITMEDVMETMLGAEIVDEADSVPDLREVAAQRRDRRVAAILAAGEPPDRRSAEEIAQDDDEQ